MLRTIHDLADLEYLHKMRVAMRYTAFLSCLFVLCISGRLWAQAPVPPPNSPDNVASRVSQLEAETQALRNEVQWLREHPVRLPRVDATPSGMESMESAPAAPEAGKDEYFTLEELRGEMKKLAWRKGDYSITPYGYLWGNTVYSTERTSPGSYTLYAQSASTTPESECIVDVRNTRLGFDVLGPRIACLDCAQTGGKVEIDFQNNTLNALSGENKSTVMLRHAYFEVKDQDFRLLVGQTWDVISPLYPGMLMYSVGWTAAISAIGGCSFAASDFSTSPTPR